MKIIKKTIIFLSVAGVKANKNEGPGRSRNRQKRGGGGGSATLHLSRQI